MKILIVGGTGTLSTDTTKLCIDHQHEVFLLNRGSRIIDGARVLRCDVGNLLSIRDAIGDLCFDVVIDYLIYDLATLKNRLSVFSGHMKQFIFISSATVFPPGFSIKESNKRGNDRWLYSKRKLRCERYLEENCKQFDFYFTIVRPYVTYGENRIPFPLVQNNNAWNMIYRIQNQLPIIVPEKGTQIETLTHTKDFAVGIYGLFLNEKAFNTDFNIVGDSTCTWNDVINYIEACVNKKAIRVYVPNKQIGKRVPSFKEEVLFDKGFSHTFDNSKLKRVVPDFKTKINAEYGICSTVKALLCDESKQVVDKKWNTKITMISNKYSDFFVFMPKQDVRAFFKEENCVLLFLKKMKRLIVK